MTRLYHRPFLRSAAAAALVLAAAIGAVGCSIKEDRFPCPCWLVLAPEENAGREGAFTLEVYPDDGSGEGERELLRDLSWASVLDGDYEIRVRRGNKRLVIREGIPEEHVSLTAAIIPEGCEADSLRVCVLSAECLGEEVVVPVRPLKQWATLFLKMETGGTGSYPYDLRLRGTFDGLDLLSLEPHRGPFRFSPEPRGKDGSEFRVRLPRQGDHSLALELRLKGSPSDSEPVDTLPLGEWIASSGYDWSAAELDDIYIGVDYARAGVHVTVNDWETVIELTEQI